MPVFGSVEQDTLHPERISWLQPLSLSCAPPPAVRSINTNAAGAVFYSVPHAGSKLADWGW